MTRNPRQMPIPMALPADLARESFIAAPCNAQALITLGAEGWSGAAWPAGKLVLTGPQGSGKTHLLHIWAKATGARYLTAPDLTDADLTDLAETGAVALDNADVLAASPALETAAFHLHNMLAERGGRLLLAARGPVRDWGLRLPDLLSRLQAAQHVALTPPDDALLAGVLEKLFADRQVKISDRLIPFLLPRMERSLAAAQVLVARLDAESLARKCAISRQLAADVMQMSRDSD
ncbi:chromosomal replication initiator DnaA [Natronohydrobacter thiooxidans]|uniref:chromosomal replication initiator DnaA n=1 Tax=Natronohydrobacter thiooxidans TaxID=87172 RepID=UPI000AF78FB4|nr:chromosomal replication initiator DnaA [Natronohydrobacter thiooxidans]